MDAIPGRDLGSSQRTVILLLISAATLTIANYAVNPVSSQYYSTTLSTNAISNMTIGVNRTVTIVQIYNTTGFTTSSSLITQVIVGYITSTTFLTYVQVTFTSSTSTFTYPVPSFHPHADVPQIGHSTSKPNVAPLLAIFAFSVFGLVKVKSRNA